MLSSRSRIVVGAVALFLCVPVGFGVARVAAPVNQDTDPNLVTHEDPDPSSNPKEIGQAASDAYSEGDAEGLEEAVNNMRTEIQSRMTPEQREKSQSASQQKAVPPGTAAFIPDSMPIDLVKQCEEDLKTGELKETGDADLCRLIVLHSEGKVRSGAFSAEELHEALTGSK